MFFCARRFSVLLLAAASSVAIASPAVAEVPLAWATVRDSTNQVTLISARGDGRPALIDDCLCPGESINTSARARAEVLFNDGSLARVGEQTNLNFWPDSRRLRLSQGTVAVFVPPSQGRTILETPNAKVGLNSTGVVVRYVPSRELTLVMALANSASGPVSITAGKIDQETTLYAGQMAFVQGGTLQIVEFDLLEFYQTSDLMAGLQLDDPAYRPAANEPLIELRPALLTAIDQQTTFEGEGSILDPASISDFAADQSPQPPEGNAGLPLYPEERRRDNQAPAGVVSPLPVEAPTVEAPAVTAPSPEPQPPAVEP